MNPIRAAFIMDQVAGHVTVAKNLRPFAEADPDLAVSWGEVHYHLDGGRIEWVHDRLVPFTPAHPFGVVRGIVEQGRALRAAPYDVIFTNTAVAHYDIGPLRRTPTMLDFDSTPVQLDAMEGYSAGPDRGWVATVKLRAMRRLFSAASLNQAWSTWAGDSVIHDYGIAPDRVVINPPGVDLAAWAPGVRSIRPGDAPGRVLFVGADFDRKGGRDLLEWHRSLPDGSVRLDIVTRTEVEPSPSVFVHRGLTANSPALRALYRDADVFVLPSHGECFGIATIEAMASALPVVVTDVGGTADIVDHGDNGFIVPAGSPRELGAALTTILADPLRARHMGLRSRELAEERFDLEVSARRTLDHLKSIAGPPSITRAGGATS
ncbi:MAG: glycosyl transferase family 1 [Acidimicrobiaceae bacterium]|nr:glycosyl transferase family 1 [Acidimicrobiaceae bacterium]